MWQPILLLLLQSVDDCCSLSVAARGAGQTPVAAATVRIESGAIRYEVRTNEQGIARQVFRTPGPYSVTVSAPGFATATRRVEIGRDEHVELEVMLTAPRRDAVTVEGQLSDLAPQGVSTAGRDQIRSLPERIADVRNALPLIPGVVRTPEGKLNIASAPEHQSTFLLNSVDVTDPATGGFGITVPVDVIEQLRVYKSPFLAEYGQFSAAVVAVTTRRGGDKWHFELNDPTPELRIRSRHIRGVRGFTPRFAATGPLVKSKLYFAGALAFALRKRPVFPLAFPYNEERTQSINSYLQFDYVRSPSHLLTVGVHGAPQRANFVGLSFLTPQPAAPWWRGHEYRASLTDRQDRSGTVFETIAAVSETRGITGPHGENTMVLLPSTTSGNYFFRQNRLGQRAQFVENVSLRRRSYRGAHDVRLGAMVSHTRLHGETSASSIFAGPEFLPIRGGGRYRLTDSEAAAFIQDGWEPVGKVRIDLGLRADWQRLPGAIRTAPRLGVAWMPFEATRTVLRGGAGLFFDRVPPIVYAYRLYPARSGVPNLLGDSSFTPRSRTVALEIDQPLSRFVLLHAAHRRTYSPRQLIVRDLAVVPEGVTRARYTEMSARVSLYDEQQWNVSYVHTSARGDLEPFTRVVGDFPAPVIRPSLYARLPDVIPHRFLTWGVFPMKAGLRVSPMIEWRNGFPYSALDARQQYAAEPNSLRLPPFFSFDWRISKDIAVRGHKVRLSFSMFNATDHANYDAVRLNVADPQFGEFLGRRSRRFRLDFDWLY